MAATQVKRWENAGSRLDQQTQTAAPGVAEGLIGGCPAPLGDGSSAARLSPHPL